jgi:hypothetical protein
MTWIARAGWSATSWFMSSRNSRCRRRPVCLAPISSVATFRAANRMVVPRERWPFLQAWAFRLAKRSGPKNAKAALARKLAALLHRLSRDGTTFPLDEGGHRVMI